MGGGLGASVLARAMAERGTRILVVEREERFRDRVRGEALAPWGVAEAKRLGIHELLATRCGSELRGWNIFFGGGSAPFIARDLVETTP
ncbi:MAG: FAD-dependent monooxygenase, partial [Chloroflexi bacterium]